MSLLHQISGCDDDDRKADVVFVHGLGGDAFATWRYGKDDATSWPCWLGEDFPEVGVWSFHYPASAMKRARVLGWVSKERWRDAGHTMPLPDRGLQVLDLMVQRGLGRRPLLFICHSLGGLVVKQVLRKAVDSSEPHSQELAANTRAVMFLATPHAGAEVASLVHDLRIVFGPTVSIEDLQAHAAHLRDLHNWYRNHAARLGVKTVSYFEQRPVKGLLIVNPTSADPGVGLDPVALDEDHLSIVKPRGRDAQVYGAARDLLRDHVLAPRPVSVEDVAANVGADARRTPHELPPAAEQFFGRETELKQLTDRLRTAKNTAVVGPAGMGKTALAAKAVRAVVGDGPSTFAASPFPHGVVFLDLYALRAQAEPVWNALADTLMGAGFMDRAPARARATEACRARRMLVIVEGGEEADGQDGRAKISELFSVLSTQNCRLLLTRQGTQALPAESVELRESLDPADAARLLDSLTKGRAAAVRDSVLELLEGHPLALTWAGNLLARDDEDPQRLVDDWRLGQLSSLSDPTQAEHTLEWLFNRSVRGLDDAGRQALTAAGLISRAPFPLAAIVAASGDATPQGEGAPRDALRSLVQRGLLRRTAEPDQWVFTHVLGYRFARHETGSDPALRERLGRWLHQQLGASLTADEGAETTLPVPELLEHAAALLRADDDHRLWLPLASAALYTFVDRLTDLGRLYLAGIALSAVAEWLERCPSEMAEAPAWLRERAVLLLRQGDVLRDRGDLAGARASCEEGLALARRLVESDPNNAVWMHHLGACHDRLADVLHEQGDLAGARAGYEEGLALARRLVESDPNNAFWVRHLSVGHSKVAGVLREQGDVAGARAGYEEGLALARRLVESDPSNAGWVRDLCVSHNDVAGVLREQGDLAGARAGYEEGLALARRLVESDPSNAGWVRDLCVSHNNVAGVLREQGDVASARAGYEEGLALARRLVESDPSNAAWRRDLSFVLTKLAVLQQQQGNLAGALGYAEESLELDERLAALDPTNATWQKDVAVSRALVARLRDVAGDS